MSKLWNKEQELAIIESQPEWIQLNLRIETIQKDLAYWTNRFEGDQKEWMIKKINHYQDELDFFKNILVIWNDNYSKMDKLGTSIEKQIEAANKGADLMDLIEDYKMCYSFEHKENKILSETFIKLCEKKGIEQTEKIKEVLNELSVNSKKYTDFLNKKINEMI